MVTTSAELEELIESTISIPTIPSVFNEVTAIFESSESSARDAAQVIKKDPAISARVLRIVNSSFYGLKKPISDIELACSILGLQVLKNIVAQATVQRASSDSPGLDVDAEWLWDHSFKAAVACRAIAEQTKLGADLTKEDAYTCGLLHDIGELILLESQRARFAQALQLARSTTLSLPRAEDRVFGFNHTHVGSMLADRWKLAPAVQAAVRHHHSSGAEAASEQHVLMVKIADSYAHLASEHEAGCDEEVYSEAELERLGLSGDLHREILSLTAASSIS